MNSVSDWCRCYQISVSPDSCSILFICFSTTLFFFIWLVVSNLGSRSLLNSPVHVSVPYFPLAIRLNIFLNKVMQRCNWLTDFSQQKIYLLWNNGHPVPMLFDIQCMCCGCVLLFITQSSFACSPVLVC